MYGVPTKVAKEVCEKVLGAKVDKTFARWLLVRSHKGRKVSGDQLLTFIKEFSAEDLLVLQAIYKHEIAETVPGSLMFLGATLALPFICVGSTLHGAWRGFGLMANNCCGPSEHPDDTCLVFLSGGCCGIFPALGILGFCFGIVQGALESPLIYLGVIAENGIRRLELLG